MTTYVTFGQDHRHVLACGLVLDKDCVLALPSESPSEGRDRAFEILDREWCFAHYEKLPDLRYFPRGVVRMQTTVAVIFGGSAESSQRYTYKTDIEFKVGDIAIIKTQGKWKFVEVVELDVPIDPKAVFEYLWIVQKLEAEAYEERVSKLLEQQED